AKAVLVQAVVMFLVLAAATTVVTLGLVRRTFTTDHRLTSLPRPADTT
ncbi:MAG: ABC transporter permease, partial [Mycobacteriaceae bacterium]